jgi:osmotically-inducible protein OsmY
MRPDAELQHRVQRALADAPRVDDTAVGVTARHGVVTLTGRVESYAAKEDAGRVVLDVPGVLDVANDLDVWPSWRHRPTDTEIAEAIRNALAAQPKLHHEQIRSTVAGRGHVRLEGIVATAAERRVAESAVRGVDGVEVVTNLIELAGAMRGVS